jgi:predicted esterase/molecular chaperone GrpE (heat shock protein)
MRTSGAKLCFLMILLLLASLSGAAQINMKDGLPRGVVIEKVACLKDNAQSYALYLPSNYKPDKKWAVLYAFDPSANGKVPVEIFRQAAEQFGFILIGSNNSRNNSGAEKLSEIIKTFWADSHARFSIDEKRVYAAGMSGGARVASNFAASCRGCIAGVILCGATFPPNFSLDKPLPFSIFGTLGTDDFNYPELFKTFSRLNEIGATNHLAIFDGRHGWLTKELTFEAIGWLNMQAMKTGRLETDKKFVADLFAKQSDKAQMFLQKGDVLEAARIYESIASDFKDTADTKSADGKLAEIRLQKSYKKAADAEADSLDEQQQTMKKIREIGVGLLDANSKNAALERLSSEIETLRKRAKADVDSIARRVARRILAQIFAETYESALYINERQKNYKTMIANLELTRLVNPQNAEILFELARAFALDAQKKTAIEILQKSIENGFKNCDRVKNEWHWRGDKEFQKIIERMKCTEEKI